VPTPTKLASGGSGGAFVPHDVAPPVELPLELDPLLVPTRPVLLDPLVMPVNPVELEELEEPEELEELEELEVPLLVPSNPVELLLDELLLEELLEELLLELLLEELLLEELEPDELLLLLLAFPLAFPFAFPFVLLLEEPLVELWPELPLPFELSNIVIAIASSAGRVNPSARPGTSMGCFKSERTNSLLPFQHT
jgi:hypothetical protein